MMKAIKASASVFDSYDTQQYVTRTATVITALVAGASACITTASAHQSFWIVTQLVVHVIIRAEHRYRLQHCSRRKLLQQFVANFYNRRCVESHLNESVEVWKELLLAFPNKKKSIAIALHDFTFVF